MRLNFEDLSEIHHSFLVQSLPALKRDSGFSGVAAGGSAVIGPVDEFSDLDFVLMMDPEH